MKYFNLILLAFIFSIISSCNKQRGEFRYTNLYATTIIDVKCENLRKSSNLKTIQLFNIETKKLIEIFSKLEPIKEYNGVDARLFGFFYQDSKRINICMSINIIEINGKQYSVNNELRDYIMYLTEKK
ncbi:hypothetical protein [Chryseobacterium sp.]|uniref:hypothetical protein n=1 Tax=Chryseobacterium sp. TaxID=1871047 RepID=UPI002FCAFB17